MTIKRSRGGRVRAALAGGTTLALAGAGLSLTVLAAPGSAADATDATAENAAAPADVTGAELRWGLNNESTGGAFAPGTWNLFSAGKLGDPGVGYQLLNAATDGATWTNGQPAGWAGSAGNVTVEQPLADGSYAETSFADTRKTPGGANVGTGATSYSGDQLVFAEGTGSVDVAAGTAEIAWDGDATVVYYSGYSFFYLSDPVLTVADGEGEVTATLGGFGSSMEDLESWEPLEDTEVTLASLTDVAVTPAGIEVTPDYLGVEVQVPEGSSAQVTGNPTSGAFPQSFVDFQGGVGTASYWYSSGGSADAKKPTVPLTVDFGLSGQVEVSRTTLLPTGDYEVTVTGSGFDPAKGAGTRPPLANQPAGAYVVFGKFAESWRPSLGASAAPSANRVSVTADQEWVTPGGVAPGTATLEDDGTFEVDVRVSKAELDELVATKPNAADLTTYGIYTYSGSGASEASFETVTPITFAKAPTTVKTTLTKAPKPKKAGKAQVAVRTASGVTPTGEVQVKLRVVNKKGNPGKVLRTLRGTLKPSGVAVVSLPRLATGKYALQARYRADANHTASPLATSRFKVR